MMGGRRVLPHNPIMSPGSGKEDKKDGQEGEGESRVGLGEEGDPLDRAGEEMREGNMNSNGSRYKSAVGWETFVA